MIRGKVSQYGFELSLFLLGQPINLDLKQLVFMEQGRTWLLIALELLL